MNDWKIVEGLFLQAAELSAAERSAFLDQSCPNNPSLRADVESLLLHDSAQTSPFAAIIGAGAARLDLVGLRVGAYEIIQAIGHGGMGSVYLAARADDQFRRKVAIKFIRRGMDSQGSIERFIRERQILANLDHPHIGKLLDGGATEEGIPYFVMEFIEGTPIDEYCDRNNLGVEARCDLFRLVCDAVSYAHRNLVIHRDLKPGNILVNKNGAPVLLDFGIAKLLDAASPLPGADAATLTGASLLTPDYASPEQVRGLPTTTATDVYSLGVVLFQLLTGSRPFRVDSTAPLEMARAVCETVPPRPSSVTTRKLAGDLDNIVLMALRKEPARRYSSVDQFSEDILRYLKGRPVIAREDTFGYRARKFVYRNRTGVLAGSLAAAALIAGIVTTSVEARRVGQALRVAETQRTRAEREHMVANQQRELATLSEQRAVERADEADIQRRKAQQRLTEMLDLGRRSLYDVQAAIEHLPGALEARRDVVVTTVQFLDKLAADVTDDPALLDMLLVGYTQSGDVLGFPGEANLGDRKGAIEAWRKGRQILTRIEKLQPKDMSTRLQDLGLRQRIGIVSEAEGNPHQAIVEYQAALVIALGLARDFPRQPNAVAQTGIIEHNLGTALTALHDPSATKHIQAEVNAYLRVVALDPDNPRTMLGYASSLNALGQNLVSEHRIREGLEQFRRSLEIREKLHVLHPDDGVGNSGIAKTHLRIASALGAPWQENLGDTAGALDSCRKAIAIYEVLTAADPGNRKAKGDLATALVYAGAIGNDAAQLRRGVTILSELTALDPKAVSYQEDMARARQYLQLAATSFH